MYSCFLECENNKQYSLISSPSLPPNHRSDMFYPSCRLVFSNQLICCIFRNIEKAYALILKLAPKRRTLQLIYLFKSFRKYRISHNYAMPQVMPHAIPQLHAAFYPHRNESTVMTERKLATEMTDLRKRPLGCDENSSDRISSLESPRCFVTEFSLQLVVFFSNE